MPRVSKYALPHMPSVSAWIAFLSTNPFSNGRARPIQTGDHQNIIGRSPSTRRWSRHTKMIYYCPGHQWRVILDVRGNTASSLSTAASLRWNSGLTFSIPASFSQLSWKLDAQRNAVTKHCVTGSFRIVHMPPSIWAGWSLDGGNTCERMCQRSRASNSFCQRLLQVQAKIPRGTSRGSW